MKNFNANSSKLFLRTSRKINFSGKIRKSKFQNFLGERTPVADLHFRTGAILTHFNHAKRVVVSLSVLPSEKVLNSTLQKTCQDAPRLIHPPPLYKREFLAN